VLPSVGERGKRGVTGVIITREEMYASVFNTKRLRCRRDIEVQGNSLLSSRAATSCLISDFPKVMSWIALARSSNAHVLSMVGGVMAARDRFRLILRGRGHVVSVRPSRIAN
jgi:hypothetical protein